MSTGVVHPSLLSQVVLHFAQELGRGGAGSFGAGGCGRAAAILQLRPGMPQSLGRGARQLVLTGESGPGFLPRPDFFVPAALFVWLAVRNAGLPVTDVNGCGASVTPVTGSPAFRAGTRQGQGRWPMRAAPVLTGTSSPAFSRGRTFSCQQLASCVRRFEMQDYL